MFHALHKVDFRASYTKQKINLACPNIVRKTRPNETMNNNNIPQQDKKPYNSSNVSGFSKDCSPFQVFATNFW